MLRSRAAARKGVGRFVVGLLLLLSISLSSHAATEPEPLLPVAADWLHLIGMAFWFAGLAHLIIALMVLREAQAASRTRVASEAARRFSLMALPSVAVLGVTGLYSAYLRLGSLAALFETLYGRGMLVKQVFVFGLLLMAGVNFLMLAPGMRRDSRQGSGDSPWVKRFGRTVLAEVILADLLLASVSLMTYLPPARTPAPVAHLRRATNIDNLRVAFAASPGWVGRNTFTVQLTPARSLTQVRGVVLTFVPSGVAVAPSEFELTDQGNGAFTGEGSYIGFPGQWLVEIRVQREGRFDAVVTFPFEVQRPPTASGNAAAATTWTAWFLILAIVVLVDMNFRARR